MVETGIRWVFVVDAAAGRLLEAEQLVSGRHRLRPRDLLSNPLHEHVMGGLAEAGTRDKYAPAFAKHADEERERQWARRVAAWLEREIERRGIERLLLCCGPAITGVLRATAGARLAAVARWCARDLAQLSEGELARHPDIAAALAP